MVNSFVQQVSIMFDSEHHTANVTNCVDFEIDGVEYCNRITRRYDIRPPLK